MKPYRLIVPGVMAIGMSVIFYYFLIPYVLYLGYKPKYGDVVFQSLPHNLLVDTIEGVSASRLSHCGIIIKEGESFYVLEALGKVKKTPLFEFFNRGRRKGLLVYGFIDESEGVTTAKGCLKYLSFPYDSKYEMDDQKIYCSELIYKGFWECGRGNIADLQRLDTLNYLPYEKEIKYFNDGIIPLDRLMITPVGLSESRYLKLTYSTN